MLIFTKREKTEFGEKMTKCNFFMNLMLNVKMYIKRNRVGILSVLVVYLSIFVLFLAIKIINAVF